MVIRNNCSITKYKSDISLLILTVDFINNSKTIHTKYFSNYKIYNWKPNLIYDYDTIFL